MVQTVKSLPAMQETRVRSLDQEDPLEKEMATRSSIFAWRIPQTEELGRLQSMGSQRFELLNLSFQKKNQYYIRCSQASLHQALSSPVARWLQRNRDTQHVAFP